jgi:hypothetical protein
MVLGADRPRFWENIPEMTSTVRRSAMKEVVVNGEALGAHMTALAQLREVIKLGSKPLRGAAKRRYQVGRLLEFWERKSLSYRAKKVSFVESVAYEAAALMALREPSPSIISTRPEHLAILVVRLALGCSPKEASMISRALNAIWAAAAPGKRLAEFDKLGGVNGAAWGRRESKPKPVTPTANRARHNS